MMNARSCAPAIYRAGTVLLIGIALLGSAASRQEGPPATALAQPLPPDSCQGDEVITFAPVTPLADEDLLVAVTSAYYHRGVWLTGTERVTFSQEREGQLGWVWVWTMTPTFAGPHRLQFFIDSTTLCAEATILVGPSVRMQATETPTPTPDTAVVRRVVISRHSGDNSGDNSSDNTADNSGDNPTATATSAGSSGAPRIASVDPASVCPRDPLTIRGQGFGSTRTAVSGKVVVSGVQVADYLSWQDDEVGVLVPASAAVGPARELFLITATGSDQVAVDVGGSSCGSSAATSAPVASATPTAIASATRTPTTAPTTTPTPTAVPAPHITSVDPANTCPGAQLSIKGQDFGASRQEVDGKVVVSGAETRDYLLWESDEVDVLVPSGAALGTSRDLYLITAGGFDHTTVNISASPC